jgi:hypothetical protein
LRIVLCGAERVGHVAQRLEHHALIVGGGGLQRGLRCAPLCRQAGIEQGWLI